MPDTSLLIVLAVTAVLIIGFIVLRALSGGSKGDAIEHAEPPTAEVPAPAAEPSPSLETAAAPDPVPAPVAETGDADSLTQIKGLGPKKAAKLNEQGITRFAQIATWSDADIAALEADLGPIADRIARDRWVEQAGLLATGDIDAFEAKFGKLG
jgi:predicted flap endonuclease-1-like 5' DNA nuclease